MASDKSRWSTLGAKHPYWAVCVEPQFRSGQLDERALEAFFESGEREMAATLATVRAMVGADFHPARALDYGCGVGRLTIPLARESRLVVAADISGPMLREAERNCAERDLTNVEFMDARTFSADSNRRTFDFVHSYIVFQHIKPRTGLRITRRILDMLGVGGVGALHFTYARKASRIRKTIHRLRRWLPPVNVAANILQRRPLFEPMIPMHEYDLRALFELFLTHRCTILNVQLTDHGGHLGAMFFLRKTGPNSRALAVSTGHDGTDALEPRR